MWFNRARVIFLSFIGLIILSVAYPKSDNYPFSKKDRDPFVPLVSKGGLILVPQEINFANLELHGIIYSNGRSLAVINGEVLEVGEQIGEYTVIEISEKEVALRKGKEVFTLKLEE